MAASQWKLPLIIFCAQCVVRWCSLVFYKSKRLFTLMPANEGLLKSADGNSRRFRFRVDSGKWLLPSMTLNRLRTELQSLKGRDGQTLARRRETSMPRGRDVAWSNARTATPKTEATTSRLGEEWGRESEVPWTYTSSPYREVQLLEEPLASPHAWKISAWKRLGEKGSPRGCRSRPIPRGGREATGPEEEGQNPLLRWLEGYRMWNPPPPPLQSRPADQRMTQRHPEDSRKNRSQEPNCSISFTRDQIDRSRPDRGDPILKEYRPDIQSRLRYDRVGEKHTRPAGWPHREATKDRWTEEAFVLIECTEKCHTTRYGWPHREGSAPTTREGARRVFVPIEIWDKLDPTGWPHHKDPNQTPGRWRKSLRFRSRTETDSTRKGDIIAKTWRETEAESPKELRFTTLEVGQMVEAGEHTPEPTNWRGSTTNGHSQSWDSSYETSRGPVHGRETSGNAAMARPQGAP